MPHRPIAILIVLPLSAVGYAADLPGSAEVEAQDAIIGSITLQKSDIFDLTDPEQDKWLYRLANRLHILTRDETIASQLLVHPGDPFDRRAIRETERLLRRNDYLYDANIAVTHVQDGIVDLAVRTRDVWSIGPKLSYSRHGSKSRTRFGLEEKNLLGRGQMLRFLRDNDIDRSENLVEFADDHLGKSWVSLRTRYSDNSDGHLALLVVERPFYSLNARRAVGGRVLSDDRRTALYQFGEEAAEYRHERDYFHFFAGRSRGLRDGRTRRWTAGFVYDVNRFSVANDPTLPAVVPPHRKLVYPFIGFELVQDKFATAQNRDQIGKTEDFQMGLRIAASLGWADSSMGSDRDAAIFRAMASRGFGSLKAQSLFVSMATSGRLESGNLVNALMSFTGRYYRVQSKNRLLFVALRGTLGEALDLDTPVELGGKTGLRGYPLRYQVGESRLLMTLEQRYYTNWYPFNLFRVGGAVFVDIGRVWGRNPLGSDDRGWLADIGFGLRLALTRVATEKVVHIDLAFPRNGDPTIDDVQLLIEFRRGF